MSVCYGKANKGGTDEPAKETAKTVKSQLEVQKDMAASLAYLRRAKESGDAVSLAIAQL